MNRCVPWVSQRNLFCTTYNQLHDLTKGGHYAQSNLYTSFIKDNNNNLIN